MSSWRFCIIHYSLFIFLYSLICLIKALRYNGIVKEVFTVDKTEKLIIPVICDGLMCAKNCSDGCLYWEPHNRDSNDRQYCNYYGTYYYPSERNGCGPFREG